MMSDASDMLAAALEQMDDIIAGSKALEYSNGIFDCQSPTSPFMGSLRVLHLIEDLRGMLEMMDPEERESLRCQLPDSTADALADWLQVQMVNGHITGSGDIYQERLSRLENDKESLVLQVSVLTDQVEAQGEKIRDLEFCLEENREKLNATEEMLQQELLSRTSLETQKLDLLTEISNLKLKLTAAEKDRTEFEDKYKDTEGLVQEMKSLRLRVVEMENEKSQFEKKLKSTKPLMAKLSSMKIKVGQMQYEKQRMEHKGQALQDELAVLKEQLEEKESDIKRLKQNADSPAGADAAALNEKDAEVQRMKKAMESLVASNEEKDRKIEELQQSLNRYKKVQDMVVMAHGKKVKDVESDDSVISASSSLAFDSNTLSDGDKSPSPIPLSAAPSPEETHQHTETHTSVLQVSIPSFSSPAAAQKPSEEPKQSAPEEPTQPGPREVEAVGSATEAKAEESPAISSKKWSSLDTLDQDAAKSPSPESGKFGTLPPKPPGHAGTPEHESFGTRKARSSFGRGFFKIKNNKKAGSAPNLDRSRSASAPALADSEKGSADHLDLAVSSPRVVDGGSLSSSPSSPDTKKKPRGIKKLFGKLKRSQSTTLNQEEDFADTETEFKRGGTRSTAGPRLGWSRDLSQGTTGDLDTPFAKWTKEQVCNWLRDQGLGGYVNNGKQWIVSGQTLLHASQQDLEKELGIKHPLHRKKLQLALQSLGSEDDGNYGKLGYKWVTRWLDDIGLPQYKTQFDEAKVDGRMLHYMGVDDLLSLKVVSVLHHLSIKRAIQVLRVNSFEPNCLRRRPSDESIITPSEVAQWTNHRVMEWLRSVDLAEYAPNLRGSGVHGGLMVLEPRFNVETMAQLLNIPPNKTLLRRHLATHFNLLVGQQAQVQKQEALAAPDYLLLTATARVKPKKMVFGNFGTLRKKKQEEAEEYVCPMDLGPFSANSIIKPLRSGLEIRLLDDEDLDRLEEMEDSEGTVRQIGAFSEGINNLTHMLKEDEMFKDFSTRSPSASITDEDSNV
ncbi:liprin-beta-1 [Spea bombifrons]|uniref:liprin-beta-1 n=1 Tax=Spea bombifrons TaxID=233779 RepID=UPI00234A50EA|nr:liprin-beta-1 [Spea bombifrons]